MEEGGQTLPVLSMYLMNKQKAEWLAWWSLENERKAKMDEEEKNDDWSWGEGSDDKGRRMIKSSVQGVTWLGINGESWSFGERNGERKEWGKMAL